MNNLEEKMIKLYFIQKHGERFAKNAKLIHFFQVLKNIFKKMFYIIT
jgi:hypothetical protein